MGSVQVFQVLTAQVLQVNPLLPGGSPRSEAGETLPLKRRRVRPRVWKIFLKFCVYGRGETLHGSTCMRTCLLCMGEEGRSRVSVMCCLLPLWDLGVEFRSLGLCYKCFYLEPPRWPEKVFHFCFFHFPTRKKKSQLLVLPCCHFLAPLYPGTLSPESV